MRSPARTYARRSRRGRARRRSRRRGRRRGRARCRRASSARYGSVPVVRQARAARRSRSGRPAVRPGSASTITIGAPAAIRCSATSCAPVLRLVVPAEEPSREVAAVRLVDDAAVRVAEHVDRRDVDDPRHAGRLGGVEHPRRRADVRVPHRAALAPWDADPVAAGGVDQRVGAAQACRSGAPTSDEVVRDELRAEVAARNDAPGAGRGRARRPSSPRSRRPLDDRPPDEPGAAGDDDAHRRSRGRSVDRRVRPDATRASALMSRSSAAPPAPSLARWSTPRTMFITGRIAMTSPSRRRDDDRALRDRLHRDDPDLGHVEDRHDEVRAEVAGVVDGERAAAEVVDAELVRLGPVRRRRRSRRSGRGSTAGRRRG